MRALQSGSELLVLLAEVASATEVSSIAISCAGPDLHAPLLPSQEEEKWGLQF